MTRKSKTKQKKHHHNFVTTLNYTTNTNSQQHQQHQHQQQGMGTHTPDTLFLHSIDMDPIEGANPWKPTIPSGTPSSGLMCSPPKIIEALYLPTMPTACYDACFVLFCLVLISLSMTLVGCFVLLSRVMMLVLLCFALC